MVKISATIAITSVSYTHLDVYKRQQQGLAGAGEWETLRKLLPDFKDKRVLDLGCGYGWHCIYPVSYTHLDVYKRQPSGHRL